MVELFSVNEPSQWIPVSEYLRGKAAADPRPEPDIGNASATEAEAMENAKALIRDDRQEEVLRYSALVIYDNFFAISLVFTQKPGFLHLSMTRIIPTPQEPTMMRLPDDIATEVVLNLLGGPYEEREGVLPAVRNFYRMLT